MKSNTRPQSSRRTAAHHPTVCHILVFGTVLCWGIASSCAATPESAPYPDALAAAAVSEDRIDDLSKRGLFVGNGELNAIIYSAGSDLRLRVAKNDCWDMRIDTSEDPPLPRIDPATGTVTGHGDAGSWKHPYPTALPCAEFTLGGESRTGVTKAALNLPRQPQPSKRRTTRPTSACWPRVT